MNGGLMPVDLESLRQARLSPDLLEGSVNGQPMDAQTRLPFLSWNPPHARLRQPENDRRTGRNDDAVRVPHPPGRERGPAGGPGAFLAALSDMVQRHGFPAVEPAPGLLPAFPHLLAHHGGGGFWVAEAEEGIVAFANGILREGMACG